MGECAVCYENARQITGCRATGCESTCLDCVLQLAPNVQSSAAASTKKLRTVLHYKCPVCRQRGMYELTTRQDLHKFIGATVARAETDQSKRRRQEINLQVAEILAAQVIDDAYPFIPCSCWVCTAWRWCIAVGTFVKALVPGHYI